MKNFLLLAAVGCSLTFTCCSTLEAQVLRRTFPTVANNVFVRPNLASGNRRTTGGSANWYPYVIARGDDRARIRETPMEYRPNRPLHFWGNSRRRLR